MAAHGSWWFAGLCAGVAHRGRMSECIGGGMI